MAFSGRGGHKPVGHQASSSSEVAWQPLACKAITAKSIALAKEWPWRVSALWYCATSRGRPSALKITLVMKAWYGAARNIAVIINVAHRGRNNIASVISIGGREMRRAVVGARIDSNPAQAFWHVTPPSAAAPIVAARAARAYVWR